MELLPSPSPSSSSSSCVWCGYAWHGMAWHGVAWHGVALCGVLGRGDPLYFFSQTGQLMLLDTQHVCHTVPYKHARACVQSAVSSRVVF